MIFNAIVLLVALFISAISAFYSITGLAVIFSAAAVPVMVMGSALELGKITAVVWLHKYWTKAGWALKSYLVLAVVSLMLITSMGTYGYLAKAHSDQTLVSGDTAAKVELVDEKIKISRENIAMSQKALEQMNSQVDQLLGRTDDDRGANRAIQVRRQQATERNRLIQEIEAEQAEIAKLNEEVAPIRAEIRKVEAEIGPIKYIAAMIYGDDPDTNLLERAVRWVIILLVLVFDPLALALMVAAQSSYKWLNEDLAKNQNEDKSTDSIEVLPSAEQSKPKVQEDVVPKEEKTESLEHELLKTTEIELIPEPVLIINDIFPYAEDAYNDAKPIPERNEALPVDFDEPIREEPDETSLAVSGKDVERLGEPKNETEKRHRLAEPSIKTEGVTLRSTGGDYVEYDGKSMSTAALKTMRPDLFAIVADIDHPINTNFGTQFPKIAQKGDVFVRVDMLPNRVYKFDSYKWIEINKEQSDSYLYDDAYIKHLIAQIERGEYDVDLLTENEKLQIEEYIKKDT